MPFKDHIPKVLFVAWSRLTTKGHSKLVVATVRDPDPAELQVGPLGLVQEPDPAIPPHIWVLLDDIDALNTLDVSSAQCILSDICQLLRPEEPNSVRIPSLSTTTRARLRRLSLKLAITHCVFPVAFRLNGIVHDVDLRRPMIGAFAKVFCGTYGDAKVAVKKLSVPHDATESQKKHAIYRESILWSISAHQHILPILGVSEDVFPGSLCMVSPWMENGSLRDYLYIQKKQGILEGNKFVVALHEWLRQSALGLLFLHEQHIVHGDIHAGNILLDDAGQIRLTDFGMSLLSEATPHGYGSIHGGGANQWRAPELIDPETFGLSPSSKRQTFASDVYSFGCTCVELYVGGPPFSNLNAYQLEYHVVKGDRPPRPLLPDGRPIPDDMWTLIEQCWHEDRLRRPSAERVLQELTDITHLPLPPELPAPVLIPTSIDEEGSIPRISIRDHDDVRSYVEKILSQAASVDEYTGAFSPKDAQMVVDEAWKHLKTQYADQTPFIGRSKLRQLCLQLCLLHNILPADLVIRGVVASYGEGIGSGACSVVYFGSYMGSKVAVKRIRTYSPTHEQSIQTRNMICKESMLWAPLVHEHVLPFYGVSEDAFTTRELSLVVPWMNNGSVRDYIRSQRELGACNGIEYVTTVDKWIYQTTLGLVYLHSEGIIHGDLHGGNILVDDTGGVRICDFGMSVFSDAITPIYGTRHGGGAIRWLAPELIDPNEFNLDSARVTYAGDVYALACVCVELYSRSLPWSMLMNDFRIARAVVNGKRPPRPSTPDGILMSDAMWSITTQCWAQKPSSRPITAEIVHMLEVIVEGPAS